MFLKNSVYSPMYGKIQSFFDFRLNFVHELRQLSEAFGLHSEKNIIFLRKKSGSELLAKQDF